VGGDQGRIEFVVQLIGTHHLHATQE
jgi:hypothetical protein